MGRGCAVAPLPRAAYIAMTGAPQWDSASYKRYRPPYPASIYKRVYEFAALPQKKCAADVGCGSGQVTIELAQQFELVVGIDHSTAQLQQARQAPNIKYILASAERTGLPADSVELVTVGASLHWFDLETFYCEARRILRPHGALAAWSYTGFDFPGCPAAGETFSRMLEERFGRYAHPNLYRLLNDRYYGLEPGPGDFHVVEHTQVDWEADMTMHDLAGFIRSISSYNAFAQQHGQATAEAQQREMVDAVQRLLGLPDQATPTRVRQPLELILAKEPVPLE